MDNTNSGGSVGVTTPQDSTPAQQSQTVQLASQPEPVVEQPVSQPVQQSVVQTPQPDVPVSASFKEGGPVAEVSTHELLQPTEAAPELAPEVKEAGVEVNHEVPQLTLADKKAGIELAKESTMYPTTPGGAVKLPPMTEAEAMQTIKVHKKIKDSLYWFALALVRQFGKKHQPEEKI